MDEEKYQQRRESFLIVAYILVACGAVFALLFVLLGPLAIIVTGVLMGTAVFGWLHWVLWGSALTRSVSQEQEEQAEPVPPEEPIERDPYRGRY
jgi:hypothetical protein